MAKDPYKYFRVEARELLEGLTAGVLELEKSASPELVGRLLRLAHTLKGAARVVKQPGIAEQAHVLEGALSGLREGAQPLSKDQGSALLSVLDKVTAQLQTLDPAAPASPKPTRASGEETLDTLRVEMQELDSLFRGVSEAGIQVGAVRKSISGLERLRDLASALVEQLTVRTSANGVGAAMAVSRALPLAEDLRSGIDRAQRALYADTERVDGELAEVRDLSHRLRLIPAHTVFSALDRCVRDAAQELGKAVEFETSGGDVRIDANVLASLKDALMHVVRNAVAHGIEAEAERVAAGKPAAARVHLEVERRGSRVAISCEDDGRGIDVEAVRKAAVARGLVPAPDAKSLSTEGVIAILARGGLSTSTDVTELSGRGIGLDVARATAARLKGELTIRSSPGRGVTVELQVPVSIASLQGLVVETGGQLAAIPLDSVRETLRVRQADIAQSSDRSSILSDGKVIPFLPLDRALKRRGATRARSAWSAVVVEAGQRRLAVGVDRLVGTSNIVMRALPGVVQADPVVSGASLDSEGNPQLVLDPVGLVAAADESRGLVSDAPAARPAPILVIDDSLTTRMLEQSILESAGYDVELAVSAEDGIAKARERRYSLFVVDVEMPGMDGFEFVAQTRADPVLREVPAILVTSRNAAEDRRRGEQVGARSYIVKSEFDQGQLLSTIRKLVG